MVLLGHFDLVEKISIELESRSQMVQCLLKVLILQICLSKLCVCRDQNEKILLMDVDKELAKSKLLNANLDHSIGILRHGKLVQSFVSLDYR